MPESDPKHGASGAPRRKIIHIDMDAFYASVEQRDNPGLRGKPVAVGGSKERGVVAAASYEARAFGVRSAMRSVTAKRNMQDIPVATDIATAIRAKILRETGLTASAGISYNKFLAKLASDHRKPNGQFVITPKMGPAFVEQLPVGKFHGIGPATNAKMNRLGIFTGMDMRNQTRGFMNAHFGKAGAYYYWVSRGVDERPVRANRIRKSVGAENTFSGDITGFAALVAELEPLIDKVWGHCESTGNFGRTVTLKVKFSDFQIITRSRSVASPISSRQDLNRLTLGLLECEMPIPKSVRLLGVSLSSLQAEAEGEPQLDLPI